MTDHIDPELAAALQAALDTSRTHIIDLGALGHLDTDTEQVTFTAPVDGTYRLISNGRRIRHLLDTALRADATVVKPTDAPQRPIEPGDIQAAAERLMHPTYVELSDPETGQRNRVGYEGDPGGRLSDALHRAFWRNDAVPGDWPGPLRGAAGPRQPVHMQFDNSAGRFVPDEPRRPYFASMRPYEIDTDRSALGQPNPAVEAVRRQTPHAWGFEPDGWEPTRGYCIRARLGRVWWWLSGLRIVHQSRLCECED